MLSLMQPLMPPSSLTYAVLMLPSCCPQTVESLNRASPYLSRQLLRMAYTSLIRTHLEYCSSLFHPSAPTHLKKLDVIQKKAARVICGMPRMAHAAPLLESLDLELLADRRRAHLLKLVTSRIEGECHSAFYDFFTLGSDGLIATNFTPRLRVGGKRFCVNGPAIYNENCLLQAGE